MIGSVIRILAAFAAAFFTGKAVSRLKLPSILGWLIAGMVLGPHGVNLLDNALLNSGPYTAMTHIFECAVGLMIGTELVWKRIRKSGKSIIITTLTQSLGTFIVVSAVFGVVFRLCGISLYLAFIFGSIALATAPAPALSIVKEFKTSGPVTSTLIPMAALDDMVGVVVFFTTSFLDFARHMPTPALWAGMGRVVRSLTIGFIAVPGVKLFQHAGHHLLTIISICLSLAVLLLFYAAGKLNNSSGEKSPAGGTAASFAGRYGLSGRENEIAELVIMSDDSINELAEQMAISGRAFQRSLTAIYEKTGTKSRLGLLRLYYECLAEEEAARESDTTA